ncbi:MAG: hypothetical protein M9921_15245 [Fimbriimonadaceae bacterium]|nr:hypothetical protein [Chthonomonadaceae bacterium]MCO5298203.1 hypothetical protein [Fimbriimonadaceae bacterium]
MAQLEGNLWEYNLVKVLVVDVTDDYVLMQTPLPPEYYPVVRELWMPRHGLPKRLPDVDLGTDYLYDWHERPANEAGEWYVGVVQASLANDPLFGVASS